MSRDTLPLRAVVCFLCRFPGARRSRASVACPALMAGHRGPPRGAPPHCLRLGRLRGRVQRRAPRVLCGLDLMLCPHPVLCQSVAARAPCARESQVRARGRTRAPWTPLVVDTRARAGGPSTRPGAGQSATGLLRVPGRSHGERDPGQLWRAHPIGSSEAAGSPARRSAPWRHRALGNPVARGSMESTARAIWWARTGKAWPLPRAGSPSAPGLAGLGPCCVARGAPLRHRPPGAPRGRSCGPRCRSVGRPRLWPTGPDGRRRRHPGGGASAGSRAWPRAGRAPRCGPPPGRAWRR